MSQPSDPGRRRFEALSALYSPSSAGRARVHTAAEIAPALGLHEVEAREVLDALVSRMLAGREEQSGGYRITSAGVRVMERTLFHRPHTIR